MTPHFLSIEDFGALGNGSTDCTAAIQKAINSASAGPCRTVLLPAGTWLSGTLTLRDNITLEFAKGATLRAIENPDLFPFITHPVSYRMDLFPWRAFIFGYNLRNLTITGSGTIECGGLYPCFHDGVGDSPDRPYGLQLVSCSNVQVHGLQFRNSAHWMMRFLRCRDVRLQNLNIYNHCNQNNDGMDIDSCEGVLISDCIIDSADDALCLKSETTYPCRDVIVRGCLLSSHASAIKLGTASIGGFENIHISDCSIRPSTALTSHHPFNLPKGMSGIDVGCVDGGTVRNLNFERISMDGVLNPIFIKLGQRYSTGTIPKNRPKECAGPPQQTLGRGVLQEVRLTSIHAINAGPLASMIFGSDGHRIKDLTLRDISIHCRSPESAIDEPNWSAGGYPCALFVAGVKGTPAYGLHLRHIDGLHAENLSFYSAPDDARPAMDKFDVVESA